MHIILFLRSVHYNHNNSNNNINNNNNGNEAQVVSEGRGPLSDEYIATNYLLPEGVENFFKASSTAFVTVPLTSSTASTFCTLAASAGSRRHFPGR